jgi:hypothetical protein
MRENNDNNDDNNGDSDDRSDVSTNTEDEDWSSLTTTMCAGTWPVGKNDDVPDKLHRFVM